VKRLAILGIFVACAAAAPNVADVASKQEPRDAAAKDAAPIVDANEADVTDADADPDATEAGALICPQGMVSINDQFCMDLYEGSLVEITEEGEKPFPHWMSPDEHTVRAVSQPTVPPQGYISAASAAEACSAAGKRLCSLKEWKSACMGKNKYTFPYGTAREPGRCNDNGRSPIGVVFPNATMAPPKFASAKDTAKDAKSKDGSKGKAHKAGSKTAKKPARSKNAPKRTPRGKRGKAPLPKGVDLSVWTKLNNAELGKVTGTWTLTGERSGCVSDEGVFDLVGNLHEWVSDETPSGNGIFAGGFFLDTSQNGDGCNYRTEAHAPSYHDYSTGFRCCAELAK
jgi:formylglycine-generating enzyme